jgi:hypothetical protein
MDQPFSTEHLLAQAAEQATTSILLLHATPGESLPRIIYANPEAHASTGHAPSALVGKSVSIFHGPETDAAAFAEFRARGGGWRAQDAGREASPARPVPGSDRRLRG